MSAATAASALGLSVDDINAQLEEAARIARGDTAPAPEAEPADENTYEFRGQTIQLPEGLTRSRVDEVMGRMRNGGFQNMLAWRKDKEKLAIEDIKFKETRQFVQRVQKNYYYLKKFQKLKELIEFN